MTPDAKRPSPPDQSGGDDARDLYDELTDDLLYDPAIGRATMMGYPCVRLAGTVPRVVRREGRPPGRETTQRASRRARRDRRRRPVRARRQVFREWVSIATTDRDLWRTLLAEAVTFARTTLGEQP